MPNQNFYSLGTVTAYYLALYKAIHGAGAECPFPGTTKSWKAKTILSSSDMIAHQTLHLSLNLPSTTKGESYNVADRTYATSWEIDWPQLCEWFGLKGTPPPDDNSQEREIRKFIKENFGKWEEVEKKEGLVTGLADSPKTFPGFEYFLYTML